MVRFDGFRLFEILAGITPQFFQETNNPGQWVGALTLRVPVDGQ